MSLITRCPACGTMFKVVPDQLRISEGWVRCGHCAEVFDASVHIQDMSRPAPVPQPVADAATVPSVPTESRAVEPLPQADEGIPVHAVAPSSVERYARNDPAEPVEPVVVEVLEALGAPEVREETPQPKVTLPDDNSDIDLHDVPFVRDARRKAFWRSPAVRAVLALLLLALLALITVQVAVQERDRLAQLQPQLRPWLLALCEPLKCTLKPPRQIEAVVVEGSTFTRLRAESYRLAFTLKNQGVMTIAMPAVELTLTDSQDQTVVRRVLMPAELGSNTGVIDAGADWTGSIAMAVAPSNGAGRVAGYRVLAFYP